MPFKIAIASGKGGTGKTTIAVNLFDVFNKSMENKVQLVDCDVEEPNDLIFFQDSVKINEEEITQLVPEINKNACTFCRECIDYCEFNAIVIIPQVAFAEVNSSLCHSCGACVVACKHNAIKEFPQPIGKVNTFKTQKYSYIMEGRLKVGSAMQTMLIKQLKKRIDENREVVIFDAPPGTSCPVVETISDTDYVILVTEPTLFGLHDLKLMVKLINEVKLPFGVIINKAGLGDNEVYHYLKSESIELLGEIPFNKDYASLYAKGTLLESMPESIRNSYEDIVSSLERKII